MQTETQLPGEDREEAPGDQTKTAALDGVNDYAMIARSEANILRWMEYLPEDCIARMIAMKWDITT